MLCSLSLALVSDNTRDRPFASSDAPKPSWMLFSQAYDDALEDDDYLDDEEDDEEEDDDDYFDDEEDEDEDEDDFDDDDD